jgi:hypothetical protein
VIIEFIRKAEHELLCLAFISPSSVVLSMQAPRGMIRLSGHNRRSHLAFRHQTELWMRLT